MLTIKKPYFVHIIQLDYTTNKDNCDCDYICRCGRIEDEKISDDEDLDFDYTLFRILEYNSTTKRNRLYKLSDIEKYSINQLMKIHGIHNKEKYDIYTSLGYYGEEISNIDFRPMANLVDDIEKVLKFNTDIEKVFFVLEKEYSYIAPIISNCTSVSIDEYKPSDVLLSSGHNFTVKRNTDYITSIDYKLPIGIISKSNFTLIDGNHRLINAVSNNIDKAYFITLE